MLQIFKTGGMSNPILTGSGKNVPDLVRAGLYKAKNYELLKTGLNNVVLPILFNVVNNIVQHCYT